MMNLAYMKMPEYATKRWSRLAVVWAFYYLAVFTVGNIPEYTQRVIWGGAGFAVLMSVPLFGNYIRFCHIPREVFLLGFFFLWALLGGLFAEDVHLYRRSLKLILEMTILVFVIAVILKYSGASHWLFLAFLGVAVLRVFYGKDPISTEEIAVAKESMVRADAANSLGFLCSFGILGALAFLRETKNWVILAALVPGAVLALYGVVLSASRSAFLALIIIAVLWPILCLAGGSQYRLKVMVVAVLILLFSYEGYKVIIQKTYLGVRFTNAEHMEDSSTQTRLELALIGLRVFTESPIFGCGLGQFGVASGTGYYAHNEVAELLATTGLPGFILYYSVYVLSWRRLSKSLKYLQNSLVRYRINIARVSLLVLLGTGVISRINFLSQESMFLLALVVGMSHWAEQMARVACRDPRLACVVLANDDARLASSVCQSRGVHRPQSSISKNSQRSDVAS